MTDVVIINRMRPGELDIHASMDVAEVMDINFSVQALNWHRDVHGGDIQLLRGGMRFGDHGLIITTSDFQRGAIEEANRPGAHADSHHQRHPTSQNRPDPAAPPKSSEQARETDPHPSKKSGYWGRDQKQIPSPHRGRGLG